MTKWTKHKQESLNPPGIKSHYAVTVKGTIYYTYHGIVAGNEDEACQLVRNWLNGKSDRDHCPEPEIREDLMEYPQDYSAREER